jgi:CheY-like chemotaxis protein
MESLKLLVVEDNIASLELITEVLTSLSADVSPVSNSEKAAVMVNQQRFDGIFLDLEMPKVDGFDLARMIRKSSWNKSVPIVIVTGHDNRGTMHEVFQIGASFYLQKPVDRQRLTNLFRAVRGALLENRRRHARVPLHTPVTCITDSGTMQGTVWNLSMGGMQIEAGDLQPGTSIQLFFRLPRSTPSVEAVGMVVWAKEHRQGVQFTKNSAQTSQAIQEFITEAEQE